MDTILMTMKTKILNTSPLLKFKGLITVITHLKKSTKLNKTVMKNMIMEVKVMMIVWGEG
jgi:hypothetical protein